MKKTSLGLSRWQISRSRTFLLCILLRIPYKTSDILIENSRFQTHTVSDISPVVHPSVSCDSKRNSSRNREKIPVSKFQFIPNEMKISTQSYLTLAVLMPVILLIHPYIAAKETSSSKSNNNLLTEDHFHLGADFETEFSSMENQIASTVTTINSTITANDTGKLTTISMSISFVK